MMPDPLRVSSCIKTGHHAFLKSSVQAWHEGVIEIGAMEDGARGALVGGNCKRCRSTIWRHVTIPTEAPAICECGRTRAQCDCKRLFGEQALIRGCL